MQKGDLVQRMEDRRLGIVISINGAEAEIIFGDGSREIVPVEDLVAVAVQHNYTEPVNFIDLVKAYVRLRGFD